MASTTDGNGAVPAKKHTAEQLAAIHAAMMEELGIGRKDTLALADKGFDDFVINPHAVKKPVVATGLGAAWHNIEFDDVDPADDELDSIADGQLYRLRRGAAYAAQQSFGVNRGRGGRADRGGRGNNGARGGYAGLGQRGGHMSPARGAASSNRGMGRRITSEQPLHTSTQKFFDDARQGTNAQARVDVIDARQLIHARARVDSMISGLRDEQRGSRKKKAKIAATPVNMQSSIPEYPAGRGQVPTSKPPKRPQSTVVWSLASSQDFLAHIGMNHVARHEPGTTQTSRPTVQSAVPIQPISTAQKSTIEPHHGFPTPADVRAPQVNSIVHHDLATSSQQGLTTQPAIAAEQPSSAVRQSQPADQVQKEVRELFPEHPERPRGLSSPSSARSFEPHASFVPHQVSRDDNENGSTLSAPTPAQVTQENQNRFIHRQAAGLSASKYANTLSSNKGKTKRQHNVNVYRDDENVNRPGQARLATYTPTDKFYTLEVLVDGDVIVHEILDDSVYFVLQAEEPIITFQAADRSHQSPPVWKLLFNMPYMAKNFYETVRPASRSPILRTPTLTISTAAASSPNTEPAYAVGEMDAASRDQPAPVSSLPASALAVPTVEVSRLCPESASEVSSLGTSQGYRSSEPNDIVTSDEGCQSPTKDLSETLLDFSGFSGLSPEVDTHRISSNTFSSLAELEGVNPLISFSDNEEEDDEEMGEADSQTLSAAMIDMLSADDSEQIKEILFKLDGQPGGTFLEQLSAEVTQHGVPAASRLTTVELRKSLWAKAYALASEKVVSNFLSESEIFKMLPDFISLMWVSDKSAKVLDLAISQRRQQYAIEELLSYRKHAYEVRAVLLSKKDLESRLPQAVRPVFRSAAAIPKPVVAASVSYDSAELPPATALPVAAPLVTAPEEWKNFQPQETDMAKWDFILNNDRKPPPSAEKPVEAKQTPPQPRGHMPSNSDCERLAQKLESFHMDRELAGHQVETSTGITSSEAVESLATDMVCRDLAPPSRPLSVASGASASASQSMTEKITNALANTSSPRVKTQISTMQTRLRAIECQVQSAHSSAVSSVTQGSPLSEIAIVTASDDVVTDQDKSELVQKASSTVASPQPLLTPNSMQDESGTNGSVTPADSLTVNASLSEADTDKSLEGMSGPTSKFTGQATQLKKGGLSASRWATTASEPASKLQTHNFTSESTPQRLNAATAPVFQPTAQPRVADSLRRNFEPNPATAPVFQPAAQLRAADNFRSNSDQTPHVPLGFPSPPPMIPVRSGAVPLMATVITRDPYTGQFRETEGLLKAGSVPVIAHMPTFSVGPHRNQENIPMGPQQFAPGMPYNHQMPSFPARSDMHARHLSESSDSDQNFKPLGPRSRNDQSANIARSNRSPIRPGEIDLQAKLQSRLNNSLAERQPSISPERN